MAFDANWILTNTLAMFDVLILGITLMFVIKIAKAYSKKHKIETNYNYFYIGIALYFIYKLFWAVIIYYQLADLFYEYGIIANLALLASAMLIYKGTKELDDSTRRAFSGT
ncbi:MAG: hypothetical protein ABIH20_02390 [Candidatus Diapherotrites archaeon]